MNGAPHPFCRARPGQIVHRMHGPGDYFHSVRLQADGRFRVERGSFRSAPPRIGRLDTATRARLDLLLARVAPLASWSYGPPVEAFEAELELGGERTSRCFRWSANSLGVPRVLAELAELMRGL